MTQLNGAEYYFFQVIHPNKEAFLSHPSTFSTALNFATSLLHFYECLYEYFRPELEVQFRQTLSSPGVLWGLVEQAGQNFGYIPNPSPAAKIRLRGDDDRFSHAR